MGIEHFESHGDASHTLYRSEEAGALLVVAALTLRCPVPHHGVHALPVVLGREVMR